MMQIFCDVKRSRCVLQNCLALILLVVCLSACKSDVPEDVLDKQMMERVLYDYHVAQSLGGNKSAEQVTHQTDISYNENYYLKSVLEKYHLSQEDFDRSLAWYSRHCEELFDIYKHLNERLSADIGAASSADAMYANALTTDTLDIWRGSRAWLLSSVGQNVASFEQECDTAVHAGDRLMLRFTSNWIYREGMKSAIVCLSLNYANDSTAVSVLPVYGSGSQELSVSVGAKPLKSISGYVYQQAVWDSKPKLCIITGVSLIRFRNKTQPAADDASSGDSVRDEKADRLKGERVLRDSLLRNDSLQRVGHHFK